ncbi:general substrate transporter [Pterulicium gracile]|uniref:General substrate transporter n=1 Tax=Pterulicium gracile TaxID=1884261 RepID=A0A5C3Q5Q7_9AGAR|nr:general substrate transporter [Pterula gracilis]
MSPSAASHGTSFTKRGWLVCVWLLTTSLQYGYHISVLNQIQAVLTCKDTTTTPNDPPASGLGLPTCIPMSDFTFSAITASFTIGGLMGSLIANLVMERYGRKGASRVSAGVMTVGAALMGTSGSITQIGLGRWLTGIASGIGLCVAPLYLAEIAPKKISGSVGVLNQLSVVFGLTLTQSLGLAFATPTTWRLVLFFSSALSIAQLLTSFIALESPAYLEEKRLDAERREVVAKLWGEPKRDAAEDDVEAPLVASQDGQDRERQAVVSVWTALTSPQLRLPLLIVSLAMSAQQLSGINAVMYYSNEILAKSLPDMGPYLSLGITIVNALMTFPPIILIEKLGRRPLLLISVSGAIISLLGVGYGLDGALRGLQTVGMLGFVMSFAIGLGPVPFVMISEVSPYHAVSALSSVALSLNWTVNFFVGLTFLSLRNWLSGGDPLKEGRVFYLFAAVLGVSTVVMLRLYK